MRLGEIKQKVDRVLNENNLIGMKATNIGGTNILYTIENYAEIIDLLETLSAQKWSNLNIEDIQKMTSKYSVDSNSAFAAEDYNKINSYINSVNSKLPVFYSILESVVEVQDEHLVNIKLPDKIKTIEDLEKFNKSLTALFKKFNLGGDFQFKGFDRGTSWYEVLVNGEVLLRYFLACIGVAYAIVHLKKTYYESEQAKLNYLTSLKKEEKASVEKQKEYSDRYVEVTLEEQVREIVEKINDTKGKEKPEIISHLLLATSDLVKQMEEGAEFHLSLNPPEYAKEASGKLVIDYTKIKTIKEAETPKQIEEKKDEN